MFLLGLQLGGQSGAGQFPEIGKIPGAAGGGLDQGFRVFVLRIGQNGGGGALFDHDTALHHQYIMKDNLLGRMFWSKR